MSADLDLARRAVAAKWKWRRGCQSLNSLHVLEVDGDNVPCAWVFANGENFPKIVTGYGSPAGCWEIWEKELPNLTDPATRGALLQLVREAWDSPSVHLRPWYDIRGKVVYWQVLVPREELYSHAWKCFEGPTEEAALVAALEAAPKEKGL